MPGSMLLWFLMNLIQKKLMYDTLKQGIIKHEFLGIMYIQIYLALGLDVRMPDYYVLAQTAITLASMSEQTCTVIRVACVVITA